MLNEDFREFFELLNSDKVRYLVVGGYALAFHGNLGYTKDLDVWLEISEENALNVLNALNDFGFGQLGLTSGDFTQTGMVVQLGYPRNRIDLINSPDGVDFPECFDRRVEIVIDGTKIPVIDLEN